MMSPHAAGSAGRRHAIALEVHRMSDVLRPHGVMHPKPSHPRRGGVGLLVAATLLAAGCSGSATVAPATPVFPFRSALAGSPGPAATPAATQTATTTAAHTHVSTPAPTPPPTPAPLPTAVPRPTERPAVSIGTATYTWEDAKTVRTAVVHYPKVAGGGGAAATAINADLAAAAASIVADWRKELDPAPAMPENPDDLTGDFTVAQQTDSVVSLRLAITTMFSGAAHPSAFVRTFTFNVESGRAYVLDDLFQPGAAYLPALASEARALVKAQLGDDATFLEEGTKPTADNYATWAVVPGGLEITFQEYQVAPHAAGLPVIVIDPAVLGDLVNPDGPLVVTP
jgi:hypothetical protein